MADPAIVVDGVRYDPVVQQDAGSWIVAESDGLIYSRHDSEAEAEAACRRKRARLSSAASRLAGFYSSAP